MLEHAIVFATSHRSYVRAFAAVWSTMTFLEERRMPTEEEALRTADLLRYALRDWGAGERRAPRVASVADLAAMLRDPGIWMPCADLRRLVAQWPTAPGSPVDLVAAFPLLNQLARRGFSPATGNLLYPLKMLMLLTGLGPAPDRRVRAGLKVLGMPGWTASVEAVPEDAGGPVARRLLALWADSASLVREELPELQMNDADVAWLVQQHAFGRLVDMALFVLGEEAATADVEKAPRGLNRQELSKTMNKMQTWGGRATFDWTLVPDGGFVIQFGHGGHALLTADIVGRLLQHFRGRAVPVGTSRDNPPAGSLGEWLQENVTPTATASYVAPVLVELGHASRVDGRRAYLHFHA